MSKKNPLTFAILEDKNGDIIAPIMVTKPIACGRCHVAQTMFVNRNGCTRCVECDRKFKEGKLT